MTYDAIKLELIEWLKKLEDGETIEYLKVVKDSTSLNENWWSDLPDFQKDGIRRGLRDIESGRTISHDDVKNRYDL
jgi:hypothetical protein